MSVDAQGDGLDANGSIYMTNGTVVVSGPTASNNGAVDYDGSFSMTGGVLIAAGSAGMVQAPSTSSTVNAIGMSYTQVQQAGALVSLKDSKDATLVAFAPKKQYQSIVIASPALKQGSAYTLYAGGTATGTLTNGLHVNGVQTGGTKVVGFNTGTVVTWLAETGVVSGPAGMRRGRP